jgi:aryl-alcohol dehydrogenase-like predicted oxidoreductase
MHSLLDRGDAAAVIPLCAAREVAYLAFSPLAGGWLTGKYRRGEPFPPGSRMTQRPEPYQGLVNDQTFRALERLAAIAAARGISLGGLALAWLLADPRVSQVVIGPGRPEHLSVVAEAQARPLTEAERAAVLAAVTGQDTAAGESQGTAAGQGAPAGQCAPGGPGTPAGPGTPDTPGGPGTPAEPGPATGPRAGREAER